MAMSRERKEQEVQSLNERFANDEIVVLALNEGLTVSEMTELRSELFKNGASYKVTKNSLARRAVQGTRYEHMADMFTGPTGVATSADPVAAAKVAHDFAKKHKKFVIVGGGLGDVALDAEGVKQLASLPSLDELRAKIVGLLQAPAAKVARVTQAPASQLARVIGAYAAKGE